MKKLIALGLTVLLILSLAACGGSSATVDTQAFIAEIESSDVFNDNFQQQDARGLSSVVKLDTGLFSDFYYAIGTGYSGEEYGVFTCNSKADAETLEGQLQARCESLLSTYASYNEEAIPKIENAVLKRSGQYVIFVIAADYNGARTIVEKYI